MIKQVKYNVLSIDAWADGDDGWTWNSWHKVGDITLSLEDSNRDILAAVKRAGYINKTKGATLDDDGYNLVVTVSRTGEPLFAIEYGATI